MASQDRRFYACNRCGANDRYKDGHCRPCRNSDHLRWVKANPEKKRAYDRTYRATNLKRRMADNLRARLRMAIKTNAKIGSAVRDLGCSVSELMAHLEIKFQPGMTWENWGSWHIDHIKPLASFDLTNREQFLIACHYTNLQPLWASDNLAKGAR